MTAPKLDWSSDADAQSTTTTRTVLAALAVLLASVGGGGVVLTSFSDGATAQASVTGDFAVTGANETVDGPPSDVTVSASGTWDVTASSKPAMVEVTLQVLRDGQASDLSATSAYGEFNGSYDLSASLFEHDSIASGDLVPSTSGESKSTDVTLRVVVAVVDGGSVIAEEFVEDTATITLTRNGLEVSITGSGEIQVQTG